MNEIIKKGKFIFVILFLVFTSTLFAQSQKMNECVKSINSIIKSNKQVYFINENRKGTFVKEIKVTIDGIVTIVETRQNNKSSKCIKIGNEELIPDCCGEKKVVTFNVLKIQNWDIHFPRVYLKTSENKVYGEIIGIKESDLYDFIKEFERLKKICEYEIEIRKKTDVKK